MDLSTLTAAELGRAMRDKKTNPIDVVEHFISRILDYQDRSVFITVTADRARREAEASAAGGAADCSAIAFTDLTSLGIAASDLPGTIDRASTDYPLPSSVWTDAPTTSSCTVTMGDTSGC